MDLLELKFPKYENLACCMDAVVNLFFLYSLEKTSPVLVMYRPDISIFTNSRFTISVGNSALCLRQPISGQLLNSLPSLGSGSTDAFFYDRNRAVRRHRKAAPTHLETTAYQRRNEFAIRRRTQHRRELVFPAINDAQCAHVSLNFEGKIFCVSGSVAKRSSITPAASLSH